jgi:hypothetical protein
MDKIQPSAPSKFSRWQTRQLCDRPRLRHTVLKFGFEALGSGPLLSPLAACWSQWWVQKTRMRYHVHLELGTTMLGLTSRLGLAPPSSDIPPSMLGLLLLLLPTDPHLLHQQHHSRQTNVAPTSSPDILLPSTHRVATISGFSTSLVKPLVVTSCHTLDREHSPGITHAHRLAGPPYARSD